MSIPFAKGINPSHWRKRSGRSLQQIPGTEVVGTDRLYDIEAGEWATPTTTFNGYNKKGIRTIDGVEQTNNPADDFEGYPGQMDLGFKWDEYINVGSENIDLDGDGNLQTDFLTGVTDPRAWLRSQWSSPSVYEAVIKFSSQDFDGSSRFFAVLGVSVGAGLPVYFIAAGSQLYWNGFAYTMGRYFFWDTDITRGHVGSGAPGDFAVFTKEDGYLKIVRRELGEDIYIAFWYMDGIDGVWTFLGEDISTRLLTINNIITDHFFCVGTSTVGITVGAKSCEIDSFEISGTANLDIYASWHRATKWDLCSDDFEGYENVSDWVFTTIPAASFCGRGDHYLYQNATDAQDASAVVDSTFMLTGDFDIAIQISFDFGSNWKQDPAWLNATAWVAFRITSISGGWVQMERRRSWVSGYLTETCQAVYSVGAPDELGQCDWTEGWMRLKRTGDALYGGVRASGRDWEWLLLSSIAGPVAIQIAAAHEDLHMLGAPFHRETILTTTAFISNPQKRSLATEFPNSILVIAEDGGVGDFGSVSIMDAGDSLNAFPLWMRLQQYWTASVGIWESNILPGGINDPIKHVWIDPVVHGRIVVSIESMGWFELNFPDDTAYGYFSGTKYTYDGGMGDANTVRGYGSPSIYPLVPCDALAYFRTSQNDYHVDCFVSPGVTTIIKSDRPAVGVELADTAKSGTSNVVVAAYVAGSTLYLAYRTAMANDWGVLVYFNPGEKITETVWGDQADMIYHAASTPAIPNKTIWAIDAVPVDHTRNILAIATQEGVWVIDEGVTGDWAAGTVRTVGAYGGGYQYETLGGVDDQLCVCRAVRISRDAAQMIIGQRQSGSATDGGVTVLDLSNMQKIYFGDDSCVWDSSLATRDANMDLRSVLISSTEDAVNWVDINTHR